MVVNTYKIVILGKYSVGKTSLLFKYLNKDIINPGSTIGGAYLTNLEQLEPDKIIKLEIWDTAGQDKYDSIAPLYYRNAYVAIILYDITCIQSYYKALKWIEIILNNKAEINTSIFLIGNKIDKISYKYEDIINKASLYCEMNNIPHYLTTINNDITIKKLFKDVAEESEKIGANNKIKKVIQINNKHSCCSI